MIKKIAGLGLSVLLITSSISSQASAWDWGSTADYGNFNLGQNMGGKVYDDGKSIGYQGFGNYTFKIKSFQPSPWWHFQAPEASVGCGGFSFKGGFMSLIQIDDLGDQLRDAGTAVAWGIIMGLVTSLPSLKEVFDTINKWARMIQDLLANACAAGEKLAIAAKKTDLVKKNTAKAKNFVDGLFGSDADYMSESQSSNTDDKDVISKSLEGAVTWATTGITSDDKQKIIGDLTKGYIPAYQNMSGALIVSTALHSGAKLSEIFPESKDLKSLPNKKIVFLDLGSPHPVPNKKEMNFRMLVGFLLIDKFGSYGLNEMQKSEFTGYANNLVAASAGKISQSKIKDMMTKESRKFNDVDYYTTPYTPSTSVWNTERVPLVKALTDWAESGKIDEISKYSIPSFYGFKGNIHGGLARTMTLIEKSGSTDTVAEFLKGSPTGNFETIAQSQLDCLKRVGTKVDCSELPPILSPEIKDWMFIYSQSNVADQKNMASILKKKLVEDLKRVFINYFEEECSASFSFPLREVVISEKKEPTMPLDAVGADTKKKTKMTNDCLEFVEKLKKGFDIKEVNKKFDVSSYFQDINKKNLQRASGIIRR